MIDLVTEYKEMAVEVIGADDIIYKIRIKKNNLVWVIFKDEEEILMRLEHLRKLMLLPVKEYIINKSVNIMGMDVHILSFTIEENKNRLWLIYEQEDSFEDELEYNMEHEYRERIKINRDEKLDNIQRHSRDKNFFIKEMEIQNQTVTFSSSSSSPIYEMNREGIMQLQHFIEKGMILDKWDDVRLKNLVIAQYEQNEDEEGPTIDNTKELDIKLHTNGDSREIAIQHPFKVRFGEQDIGTKIIYFDEDLARENYFFINEVYSFDVYEDIKKKAEEVEDVEMRENMLNNFMEALERVCPRDKNLAVIKYETVDDTQLNFYLKDYLDGEPIIYRNDNSTIGGASSVGIIWGSNEKGVGINGYKLRECVLQPIDKNFTGELELELFSRYLQIPGETVRVIE